MHTWILEYLRCPSCRGPLALTVLAEEGSRVTSGVLVCTHQTCQAWYPIVRAVPRMLPAALIQPLVSEFVREHQSRLDPRLVGGAPASAIDSLEAVKKHTIQNFGFEWLEYSRFGWDDQVYNVAYERSVFERKSLLNAGELKSATVLDAGCGNGRYSYQASQDARHVIGIDLGDGVESASQNNKERDNVQIVQGDIFNLPLADSSIDIVFSIGVLMHTGDAKAATRSLRRVVKPGGSITIHLYGKGNPVYELVDRSLREYTTRLSVPDLQRLTNRLFQWRRRLEAVGLSDFATRFIRLDSHPHCIFDWYAAPVASHHTYPEVREWFREFGLSVVGTNEPQRRNPVRRAVTAMLGAPGTVTVRGRPESTA